MFQNRRQYSSLIHVNWIWSIELSTDVKSGVQHKALHFIPAVHMLGPPLTQLLAPSLLLGPGIREMDLNATSGNIFSLDSGFLKGLFSI